MANGPNSLHWKHSAAKNQGAGSTRGRCTRFGDGGERKATLTPWWEPPGTRGSWLYLRGLQHKVPQWVVPVFSVSNMNNNRTEKKADNCRWNELQRAHLLHCFIACSCFILCMWCLPVGTVRPCKPPHFMQVHKGNLPSLGHLGLYALSPPTNRTHWIASKPQDAIVGHFMNSREGQFDWSFPWCQGGHGDKIQVLFIKKKTALFQ